MDEDFDFDDGGGSPEDYGMTQADFDAATEVGRDVFSDTRGGDDAEGFSSFALNLSPQQTYTVGRGATATNPFPDSIFSKFFGAENVDYTNILGSGGIADIQNLRFRQGMNPSQFKMGDFYVGQPTVQGQVEELPQGGILGLIEQVIPGISTLSNIFGRNRGLPKDSQAYQDKLKEIQESQDNIMQSFKPITDFVGDLRTAGGDLIDRFYSGIGSLERRFRDAITPRNMTDQGVSSLNQRQATEADENVAEALQLVPQVRNFSFTPVDKQFLNRQPVDPRLLNQLELINQNRENRMRAQLGV